ncbi:hypothetical protein LX15_005861 [Streptoalloteichus tenebrarius]|uniref:Uncharacterized protein n=2 Tax=Streptoalloteichus tenebrarius (strain ATCC 17920 / DSM 40477 / JCM 4838 / CBS 697.72 / NBRC 16177 / NCIMB 11028 / NRRL B-12390 / A12253. 1 / ISP 5477) TaxID=1933 RepID=A0ABT1I2Y2_STRSD|nr:hypothetical protein [Streptoalloteichus tenebrarius]
MVVDQLVDFMARTDFGLSREAREVLVDVYADVAVTAARARAAIAEVTSVEERIGDLDFETDPDPEPGAAQERDRDPGDGESRAHG